MAKYKVSNEQSMGEALSLWLDRYRLRRGTDETRVLQAWDELMGAFYRASNDEEKSTEPNSLRSVGKRGCAQRTAYGEVKNREQYERTSRP